MTRSHFPFLAAGFLLLGWSSSLVQAAEQEDFFICATPQITAADRARSLGREPIELLSKLDKRSLDPLMSRRRETLDLKTFQLMLGKDAWTSQDSLSFATDHIVLAVHYLDGSPEQRALVERYAQEWTRATASRIRFVFDSTSRGHIRISFAKPDNRSEIGRQASLLAEDQPTMHLGEVRAGIRESRIKFVVLHEFGHALGLRHEHQHPQSGIKWNETAILADLAPFGWKIEQVRSDITNTYALSFACTGAPNFDKRSVMVYPIPERWTIGDFSVLGAAAISNADRACVLQLYNG